MLHGSSFTILISPAPKPIVIEERIGIFSSTAPAGPVKLFDLNADQNAARKVHAPDGGGSEQQAQPPNGTPDTGSGGSSSAPRNGATMDHVQAAGQPLTNATVASAQVDATADAPESAAPAAVDANDPAWQDVESAHFNVRRQGMAIVRYDEYRRNNPGKNTALLDKYQDEAVNWLYWQRIAQLWTKQDDLGAQIKQKDMDLRNQPSGEFHDQLAKDRAELQTKLDSARREMTDDMGYEYRGRAAGHSKSRQNRCAFAASECGQIRKIPETCSEICPRQSRLGLLWDGE